MSSPDLTEAEVDAVNKVLRSRVLSIGRWLDDFEAKFAAYVGSRHAVGVSSGTAALHMALIAAGVERDDVVLTSPFSFVASANVALYEGAIPIFVDVEESTGNICPALVQEACAALNGTEPERSAWLPPKLRDCRLNFPPKVVLPIHAFGQPADMTPLGATAREYGATVVEDACEAIGAHYQGQAAGTFGQAACFAFYPNKQMTTGEGGMITTNDDGWVKLLRSLRNQGRDVFDTWLSHTRLGFNYRLNELSAALGVVQLERLEELLAKRARVAGWYNERLQQISAIERPQLAATTTRMSWFVYVVRFSSLAVRDGILNGLNAAGIPSRPYFTPIHLQPFYVERFGYARGCFPVTERLADTSLALPFSSVMTEEQVDHVCNELVRLVSRTD
jgi:perosamine synthetase